eukprot:TRINITY_DN4394_c0_g1_i2.p1 TRINITY_DN4394_c0_g1~~TRINITY_DN4394_c0_g1_i2.p1  ORF type:complete len:837 (-),score=144.76 TRINITY_DN4394_c0_g1_i2:136-2646(-)
MCIRDRYQRRVRGGPQQRRCWMTQHIDVTVTEASGACPEGTAPEMLDLCGGTCDEEVSTVHTPVLYSGGHKVECNITAMRVNLWAPDAPLCSSCHRSFTLFRRRHHCRSCGRCVCGRCSQGRVVFGDPQFKLEPQPVCDMCVDVEMRGDKNHQYQRFSGSVTSGPSTGTSIERPTNQDKWPVIEEAIKEGDVGEVARLYGEVDVNRIRGRDGWTALTWASNHSQHEVVKILLDHRADIDAHDDTPQRRTPLLIAASQACHIQLLTVLLQARAQVDKPAGLSGRTALMTAAAQGLSEVVRTLLHHGADPCIRNSQFTVSQFTALDYARNYNHSQTVAILDPVTVPDAISPSSVVSGSACSLPGRNQIELGIEDPNLTQPELIQRLCGLTGRDSMLEAVAKVSPIAKLLEVALDDRRVAKLRRDAALSLARLSESFEMRLYLIESGVVKILLDVLCDELLDTQALKTSQIVVDALDQFISTDEIRARMMMEDLLAPLKTILGSLDPRFSTLQKLAAILVSNIAKCPSVRTDLIVEGIVNSELLTLVEKSEDRFCTYWATQAVCVICTDYAGRVAVVDAGYIPMLVSKLVHEQALVRRGAVEALLSLAEDGQAAIRMMQNDLVGHLEGMLQFDSDLTGRDVALTLLSRICQLHPIVVPQMADSELLSWVVGLIEVAADEFDDDIECDQCGEPLSTEGRRFQLESNKDSDLCVNCGFRMIDESESLNQTEYESSMIYELPRDKAVELLMAMLGSESVRQQVVQHGAVPHLASWLADGTHFGISCALSIIRTLVLDRLHTAELYEQGGCGPVAVALGVPVAKASVKAELIRLGLPCEFLTD